MATEETKHDLLLKRTQVLIAILAGLVTFIIGTYNAHKIFFANKAASQIAVTVRSDRGQEISSAHLEFYDEQNALIASSETDAKGSYVKTKLDPGNYIIKAAYPGFEPQALPVRTGPGKTTELQILLKPIPVPTVAPTPDNAIRKALEETGAAWIKKLAKPKDDSTLSS